MLAVYKELLGCGYLATALYSIIFVCEYIYQKTGHKNVCDFSEGHFSDFERKLLDKFPFMSSRN